MRRFLLLFFAFIVFGTASLGTGYLWLIAYYNSPGPLMSPVNVWIKKGSSAKSISKDLQRAGVIDKPIIFEFGRRILGKAKPLRAGEFSFKTHMSAANVVAHLQTGKTVLHKVTIAEGLSSAEVVELLANYPRLTGNIEEVPREGVLLPETYYFARGDSRASIIRRMRNKMKQLLMDAWKTRSSNLPFKNSREAVILASIIEKETGMASERSQISGVFINRLRLGMRLQSDPTVIYGITRGRGPLGRAITKADLRSKTPYNTYIINALPPGPIANPGRASIEAALNPARTGDLYFVANGNGGHAFAGSLKEHVKNVKKWREIELRRRRDVN